MTTSSVVLQWSYEIYFLSTKRLKIQKSKDKEFVKGFSSEQFAETFLELVAPQRLKMLFSDSIFLHAERL